MTSGVEMTDARSLFVDEAREYLQLISDSLLRLEEEPDRADSLNELFRAMHSLKGMAATMGYGRTVELAHASESLLDRLRSGGLEAASRRSAVDALFEAAGALEQLIEAIASDGGEPPAQATGWVTPLVERLEALRGGAGDGAGPAAGDAPDGHPNGGSKRNPTKANSVKANPAPWTVSVRLAQDTPLKGVRAYTVLRVLEGLGELIRCIPSRDELEEEAFDDRFQVVLHSGEGAEAIRRAVLAVTDVVEAEVGPGEQGATPGSPAEENGSAGSATQENGQLSSFAVQKQHTVRVETARLDALVDLIGELVITQNNLKDVVDSRRRGGRSGGVLSPGAGRGAPGVREPNRPEAVRALGEAPREAEEAPQAAEEALHALAEGPLRRLERISSELQETVMKLRMVPLQQVFSRFPRVVRDLAHATGKRLRLLIEGEQTELDRTIVNQLGDPLLHLLRNAVDHGIEPPEERLRLGKPEVGQIRLSARTEGNQVTLELEDDGRGIDPERIRQKLLASGRFPAEEVRRMDRERLIQFVFEPGFSTADRVTETSGRGVGVDAARAAIEAVGGRLSLHTEVGKGTVVHIRLPLTLAILRALLVRAEGETYALPLEAVRSIEQLRAERVESLQGHPVMRYRGRVIPIRPLVRTLEGLPPGALPVEELRGALAVVVESGRMRAAIAVDEVLGQQEVVIKSLGRLLGDLPGLMGATILGSGRVALIVDAGFMAG